MEQADLLLGLMESAVGLAGFTAVVLVLRPQQLKLGVRTILGVRVALANSMAAVFACLVALGVSAAGVDGSTRWRVSSAIYLASTAYFLVFFFRDTIRGIGAGVRYWQAAAIWFVSGIHLLLHLSNVVGFPIDPSFGCYYLASILILSFGALQFFIVALGLLRPPA